MMATAWILVAALVAASLVMMLAFRVQQRTGKSGWVDTIWTYSTGAFGAVMALIPGPGTVPARQILVALLALFWALRLGTHILQRTLHGGDDPRYAKLKEDWGPDAPRRMFWFLQVQAVTVFLLVAAIFAAARNARPTLGLQDALAVLILVVAVAGEGLADRQLKAFAKNPANKGKVCDIGLWRWSRHPNYFFEWMGWFAYPMIAVDLVYPWGLAAFLGPALLYWLLVYASGIPPLEAHMLRTRAAAFRAYQAKTSAFFPWPPKSGSKPA